MKKALSMRIPRIFLYSPVAAALLVVGCQPAGPSDPLERQGQAFVELALALGGHKASEVDAYFGPPTLDTRANTTPPPLADLQARAQALLAELEQQPLAPRTARLQQRLNYFIALLANVTAAPKPLFADEARELYGIELPVLEEADFKDIIEAIDALLPGTGNLPFRVAAFRNQLVVPAIKRAEVFERALAECKARTLQHWPLPDTETVTLEWTREVPAAWHRYEGEYRSTLQVNPLSVAFIGSAIDVACHEGYPGHHAQFVLMESAAGESGLPVEETVVLLRSPDSVLREGAANYGVDLVFPPAERLAFERDVLFPLAGISAAQAEKHQQLHQLLNALSYAALPILADYRDGGLSFNSSTFALERQALVASPSALLEYVNEFGAYSAGYTVARDLLQDYVEGKATTEAEQWALLREVLINPAVSILGTPASDVRLPAEQTTAAAR